MPVATSNRTSLPGTIPGRSRGRFGLLTRPLSLTVVATAVSGKAIRCSGIAWRASRRLSSRRGVMRRRVRPPRSSEAVSARSDPQAVRGRYAQIKLQNKHDLGYVSVRLPRGPQPPRLLSRGQSQQQPRLNRTPITTSEQTFNDTLKTECNGASTRAESARGVKARQTRLFSGSWTPFRTTRVTFGRPELLGEKPVVAGFPACGELQFIRRLLGGLCRVLACPC